MMRTPRLAISALLALVVASSLTAPAHPAPAVAPLASTLSSNPTAIDTTLSLGATRRVSLDITNSGGAAVTAQLFEGLAPDAAGALLADETPAEARATLPAQADRVDPELVADLAPDGRADFLVFLADQPDLAAAYAIDDWAQRGWFVYRTLRDHAERTQAGLRDALTARGLSYQPLWVVNALIVRDGAAADVAALSGRSEVAMLRSDREVVSLEPPEGSQLAAVLDQAAACEADADNVCWNVARVGASRVWKDFGARGQGIVVGSIDSGVSYSHPALVGSYRGNRGGSFDHNYSWYDGYGVSTTPVDLYEHGTHTLGTMVAAGTADASAPAVGLAPGARWVAARGCYVKSCDESALLLAAQWMLAPTDLNEQNPRPDLRPHIVNNSWSGKGGNNWYAGYTAAWRAAGMFPVFAAGNSGNLRGCGTIQSPGDYSEVVGVGAVGSDDRITDFSSVGPTVEGGLKPDLTAPGSGILSTSSDPGAPYEFKLGTSMAAPHVAGAVALLWSANPALIGDYDETYRILTRSAEPMVGDVRYETDVHANCKPTARPNNIYGWGRLDTYAAVAEARVDVPWLELDEGASLATIEPSGSATVELTLDARRVPGPGTYQARVLVHSDDLSQAPLVVPVTMRVPADPGHATLSGRLTRASDGAPVVGRVRVAGGAEVATDSGGRYSLTLPAAATAYTVSASAPDYAAKSAQVSLAAGEQASLDFALNFDLPILVADTAPRAASVAFGATVDLRIPVSNQGTKPISFTLSLPAESYGVWRSEESDGPDGGWISPPAGATVVPLLDDAASEPISLGFSFPFYGKRYTSLQVGANGILSFAPIALTGGRFVSACSPILETPGAAIAVLRLDLDPSKGGKISYARLPEGFLVSWEDVPAFDAPTRKLSFQALLRPDGRVSLNYRNLASLRADDNAAYGLQASSEEVQLLGCRSELGIVDGSSVELRPQVSSALWMALPQRSGTLAPGASGSVLVRLRWAPAVGGPASGGVMLASNDPLHPKVRLTVRMQAGAPSHQLFFPQAPNAP